MNKTITLQVGNSDNKLTQKEWHAFVMEVNVLLCLAATEMHFSGGSSTWSPWQNMAWIFTTPDTETVKAGLAKIRSDWRQDSVAWIEGEVEFI